MPFCIGIPNKIKTENKKNTKKIQKAINNLKYFLLQGEGCLFSISYNTEFCRSKFGPTLNSSTISATVVKCSRSNLKVPGGGIGMEDLLKHPFKIKYNEIILHLRKRTCYTKDFFPHSAEN